VKLGRQEAVLMVECKRTGTQIDEVDYEPTPETRVDLRTDAHVQPPPDEKALRANAAGDSLGELNPLERLQNPHRPRLNDQQAGSIAQIDHLGSSGDHGLITNPQIISGRFQEFLAERVNMEQALPLSSEDFVIDQDA